ncbi:hypothetical protein diail_4197, partial [Diaporthe ilicicola]
RLRSDSRVGEEAFIGPREAEKEIKARTGRVTKKDIDVTDSSTDSSSGPSTKRLAAAEGAAFNQGKDRAERLLARKKFKRLIPKSQYDDYWTREDLDDLERWAERDKEFQKRFETKEFLVGI